MKKLCNILTEITYEAYCGFIYFIKSNLTTFSNILSFILPYMMYFLGKHTTNGNKFDIGYEAIIMPLVFFVLVYYLRSTANKVGTGKNVPIPDKRFTEVDEDGEVRIEHKRIQELILYMADLEDWMERKGML